MGKKEYNVLVLGSSGVGKSTFINSIANYFKYDTFEQALQNKVECVIPTCFEITDEDYERHLVTIGQGGNENFDLARSTTQKPHFYAFEHADFVINLIDAPGIGDTRGVDADDLNVKAIFDALSAFTELHAVCILLKTTDSVMSTDYQYCLNELLMKLPRTAVNNLLFVFTCSRAAQFVPGSGFMVLKKYLDNLAVSTGVSIKPTKENIFCVDNDAFRFQCAHSQIQAFKTADSSEYTLSWTKSKESVMRLFKKVYRSTPLAVLYIQALNQARNVIDFYADATKLMESTRAAADATPVQLAGFLKRNAILVYNIAFEERMNQEIKNAKSFEDEALCKKLEATLLEYRDKKHQMEGFIQRAARGGAEVGFGEVESLCRALFGLPFYGPKIKELHDRNIASRLGKRENLDVVRRQIELSPF